MELTEQSKEQTISHTSLHTGNIQSAVVLEPTFNLRWNITYEDMGNSFISTGVRVIKILQQEWKCKFTGTSEWRDIPEVNN